MKKKIEKRTELKRFEMDEYRNNSNFLTITLAGKSAHYR